MSTINTPYSMVIEKIREEIYELCSIFQSPSGARNNPSNE